MLLTVGLVARLAGAQSAHPSLSLGLGSGAQEFSSIKKYQRVLVPELVLVFLLPWPFLSHKDANKDDVL
jgi:hypothetical protein